VLEDRLARLLGLVERLLAQKPKDKDKLYSLHAPEVVCISKGKARTPYEFGAKVGIATTNREGLVLASVAFERTPYDGHTLDHTVAQAVEIGGIDYLRTVRNPPESLLARECERGLVMADRLRRALPKVELSTNVTALADGLCRVEIALENTGYLPTSSLHLAPKLGACPKVSVQVRGAKSHAKDAVVGIFTERDYLTKVVVKGRNSSNTKISEIMTPSKSLVTVTPQHSVLDVMELMVEKNFRHVPVVDGDSGTMSGMVSIRDVVHVMLKEHREEVGRLNEYIQGTF